MARVETFGEWDAAFYSLLVRARVFDWAYRTALKVLGEVAGPGSRVLEVGPGVGRLLELMDRRGYRPVGVDISPPMARRAARRGDVVAGASWALPSRSSLFDAAVALFTVHHWGEHGPSLEAVMEALKPGGSFVVIEVDRARMPLVGSHGMTMKEVEAVFAGLDLEVRRMFPLIVAVAKRT